MKILVLHLGRSSDRREHMLKEIARHKTLDIELFYATDYRDLELSDIEKFCNVEEVKHFKWLTMGAICACYSHYLIYQKIIEQNWDLALITEDDVIFQDGIEEVLANIEQHHKTNEVILLHYVSWNKLHFDKKSAIQLHKEYNLYESKGEPKGIGSAAGYIITREAAKTLSNLVLPVRFGTDDWFTFMEQGGIQNVRFVYPQPVIVAGFKSNATAVNTQAWNRVTEVIDKYKIPGLYHLFRFLRKRSVEKRTQIVIE